MISNRRSEGSLNQHIKLKHPEYYAIHLKGKEGSIQISGNKSGPLSNQEDPSSPLSEMNNVHQPSNITSSSKE